MYDIDRHTTEIYIISVMCWHVYTVEKFVLPRLKLRIAKSAAASQLAAWISTILRWCWYHLDDRIAVASTIWRARRYRRLDAALNRIGVLRGVIEDVDRLTPVRHLVHSNARAVPYQHVWVRRYIYCMTDDSTKSIILNNTIIVVVKLSYEAQNASCVTVTSLWTLAANVRSSTN